LLTSFHGKTHFLKSVLHRRNIFKSKIGPIIQAKKTSSGACQTRFLWQDYYQGTIPQCFLHFQKNLQAYSKGQNMLIWENVCSEF
jgi:hypothetical protein